MTPSTSIHENGIPPERLAQIAARRLAALQIPHQVAADRQTVEGIIHFSPGRVVNPVTGVPLGRSRFVVVGHDRLRFTEPPLAALDPISFYEARTPVDIETPIVLALGTRGELIKQCAAKFESLKLEVRLDPEALVARGLLDTGDCRFELEGGAEGVRLRRFAEAGQKPSELPADAVPLDMNDFPTGVDLELHLSDRLAALRTAASHVGLQAEAESSHLRSSLVLESSPPPVGTPTLQQLAQGFGPGAVLVPGPRLEVAQEFAAGGSHYRFVAQQEAGNTFRAKLMGPRGVHWQDRIDLERFPGMPGFVASVLGIPERQNAAASGAPSASPASASPAPVAAQAAAAQAAPEPAAIAPAGNPLISTPPGEVWVMAVVVERQEGDEVRYACTDVNGRLYGAPRVLRRADFERVFVPCGAGWRLLIRIERTEGETVYYRQLDSTRQPAGEERKLHATVLASTFVPEAAAY